MAIELYTFGTGVLVAPVVAQLWHNGAQQGADIASTAAPSGKHFIATVPIGTPAQLTDGYQVIWRDSTGFQIPGDILHWDGAQEIFRGDLSVDESSGSFI